MKAIVLAAGKGRRMLPLSENRPKHLIPVAGRPFLYYVLRNLELAGLKEIGIVVCYKRELIEDFLRKENFKARIRLIQQKKPLGTAHAIASAEKFVGGESFLVVMGENLYSPKELRELAKEDESIYVGCKEVEDPSNFGVLICKLGLVKRIVEKPRKVVSKLANVGAYKFTPAIFDAISQTKLSPRKEYEITDSISLLAKSEQVRPFKLRGYWIDFTYPWHVLEVNEWLLSRIKTKIKGEVSKRAMLKGNVIVEEGVRIRENVVIDGPCFIGKNSEIGPSSHLRASTSIGADCKVGSFCVVKNSVIMGGTKIPHLNYVGDSIIGENCNLGASTITANLRFDGSAISMLIEGKRVCSKRRKLGVVMGDNSKTGIGVCILPGRKIGCNCLVDPGCVVYKDLPSGKRLSLRQKQVIRCVG
jgi:bifunctional UDP-N-acetylglucosamine pyrophosphorylase/glucosamine-1-phosphate N-acetyltransferase